MPLAIEEILRFESPEQRTSFRIVLEPFELAGRFFEPGTQIGAILGAANRDPAQFSHPDIFDIRRDPNSHLAFGLGIHHCLGKFMARMEANVALSEIMKRCPDLGLVSADPVWRPNSFFRGLVCLPAVMSV
jgi:cytochrome P450